MKDLTMSFDDYISSKIKADKERYAKEVEEESKSR